MTTRVYAYGTGKLDKATRATIEEQLRLAYLYRLALWRLTMAQRQCYRDVRRELVPDLVGAEAALAAATTKDDRLFWKERLKTLRIEAKDNPELVEASRLLQERHNILHRALRKVFSRVLGLYSGTYLHVEAAARSAGASTEDPQRPRWTGSGALAIQLQGGLSRAEVHGGSNPSLHIEPPNRQGSRRMGSRTVAYYRVRSDDKGRAVLVALPLVMHRELPEDARVTWARLVVKKIHEHRYHYSLQLTVESALAERRGEGAGTVVVCFADNRILFQCEHEGEPIEMGFPLRVSELPGLQSVRDKHRNAVIKLLSGWCELQDSTADWVRAEIELIQERKSCRRLYHLRKRLRDLVDEDVMKALDEWAYRENHLYWWFSDVRTRELRARKNAHRNWAAQLRSRFRTLVVDSRRLDDRSRLTYENRWLGLHELRMVLIQAFGEDAYKVSGDSCAELLERYRRNELATPDPIKKPKRTGFAHKHKGNTQPSNDA